MVRSIVSQTNTIASDDSLPKGMCIHSAITTYVAMYVYEPLIKDPPRRGHPLSY